MILSGGCGLEEGLNVNDFKLSSHIKCPNARTNLVSLMIQHSVEVILGKGISRVVGTRVLNSIYRTAFR